MHFYSQQVKSGIHEGRLTQHDMSSSVASPSLPFSGTPLPPMVDLASQHAEGHGNEASFLENNSINKSETSESPSDKSTCASYAAIEGAKTQDYPYPRPIPEGKNGTLPVCTNQICWTEHIYCPDSNRICRGDCQSNKQMLLKLKSTVTSPICVCFQKCCMAGGVCLTWRTCTVWSRPSIAGASERRPCRNRSKNIWSI